MFLVGAHDLYTQSEGNPTYIQAIDFAIVSFWNSSGFGDKKIYLD